MSEIDTSGGGGKHKGKKRGKKLSTRIDMTPMVDLAFLLVTFFMLATTLSKPSAMPVTMPDPTETDIPPNVAAESKSLTIILGKDNKIFYHRYSLKKSPEVFETTFGEKNVRKELLEKKEEITNDVINIPGLDQTPIVIIMPTRDSKYKNLVDILDEMKVTDLQRFVVVSIAQAELDYLAKKGLY